MKELSTSGVAGVNLFGQVDDVDAKGYLETVDFEETTEETTAVTSTRAKARRNVVTVVLIYNNVVPFVFVDGVDSFFSCLIRRVCFRCFRDLRDDILRRTFYGYHHNMQKICLRRHCLLCWHTEEAT